RRARQLHAAARQIVAAGEFPSTVAGLQALPGVGAYTAAAIASIAFGVAAPVMDGNVERVLCRFLALEEEPRASGARRSLPAAAPALPPLSAPERLPRGAAGRVGALPPGEGEAGGCAAPAAGRRGRGRW